MPRHILAVLTIVLFASGVAMRHWWPDFEEWWAWCWRGGAIFAATWLAYDDVQRLPNWLLVLLPFLAILLIRWPKLLLALIPLLILWAILRQLLRPGPGNRRG